MCHYFIGTSGWQYSHWKERFYPADIPQSKWLEYYAQTFPTVELNASFYRLPQEETFRKWRTRTPDGFIFAVKASRFITHIRKLKDCEEPLTTFLSRARLLGERLGPILYQLPPGLKRDDQLLESFLTLLPTDLKHAFEFRSETWLNDSVFSLLRYHQAGFCIYDMPNLTTPLMVTTSFAYVRFHGSSRLYGGCYSDDEIKSWAGRLRELGHGLDEIYIYFNNDAEGFAVQNAQRLESLLGN